MTTDPSTHLFWITSRAAGTTALVLSSAAVGYGLAMAGRLGGTGARDRRSIHEILALATIAAIAVHGLALVGDSFLHASVLDVTVPLVFSYKPLWTSVGIVAGWGTILLGLSFYVRERIGVGRWKAIHRFTVLAWAGGLVHTFGEGSDAGQLWFVALIAVTSAPAVVLLALRVGRRRSGQGSLARTGAAGRELDRVAGA
jgi:sulfoxide reductase heme-binding subunit YedZ